MAKFKPNRFYVDWWTISTRAIYLGVVLICVMVLAGGAALYVWAYGNPLRDVGKNADPSFGARFVYFEGDVRVIRASTRETLIPTTTTRLYPGDTVQTQADGRARIGMVDGSVVVVRPNSTVIIRDNTSLEGGQRTNVRVALDDGQINVRTEDQNERTTNVVEVKQAENKLSSQTDATFGINPETNAAEIRIATGSIETTTASGEKTTLHGGEFAAVNQQGTIAKRERLLNVPLPAEPHDLSKIYVGPTGTVSVALHWLRPQVGAVAHYRIEVATSPFFVPAGRVIERDQLVANELSVTDLRPGNYFWRVRANAQSGQVSEWSEPSKFLVAPRGSGAKVVVSELISENLGGNVYIVSGVAPPGTTIGNSGREVVAANDGKFQLQLTVVAGTKSIVVTAHDVDGNSTDYNMALVQGPARHGK